MAKTLVEKMVATMASCEDGNQVALSVNMLVVVMENGRAAYQAEKKGSNEVQRSVSIKVGFLAEYQAFLPVGEQDYLTVFLLAASKGSTLADERVDLMVSTQVDKQVEQMENLKFVDWVQQMVWKTAASQVQQRFVSQAQNWDEKKEKTLVEKLVAQKDNNHPVAQSALSKV